MIIDHLLSVAAFNLARIRMGLADIPDDQLLLRPLPECNPALWIVGHLAVTTSFGEALATGETLSAAAARLPDLWKKLFAPGTDPAALGALPALQRPTRDALLARLTGAHEAIAAALPRASEAMLNRPNEVRLMQGTPIKTAGDFIIHLLTTHMGFHGAQISALRRHLGFPPMM
jgi:hypothetical protein